MKGWVTSRLRDIAQTQYGLSVPMNEEGKGFKIFRMGEVQEGQLIDTGRMKYADIHAREFEQYKLRTGDVLFNRTNSFELVGKTGIFDLEGDYCFASYLVRLNLDRSKVLPEFLNYFMNSDQFQRDVKEKASKSINQANINATILSNELIHFPASLAEQKRIVGILAKALKGIATAKDNAENNLQNTRALYENYLQSVFSKRGAGWLKKRLSDVCTFVNGRAYKRDEMLRAGRYPLLRVGNFFTNKDWFYSDLQLEAEKYCDTGDLLYAWSASFGPRIWDGGKVIYHYHIWKVLPKTEIIDKEFLFYLLKWDVERIKQARGTWTTMMHVSKGSMENLPIPPRKEQIELIELLDRVTEKTLRLDSIHRQKLTALEKLRQSLLHQAFNGQL